jgi:hypothetical protein
VTVPISLPKDPFSINGKSINIQFAASDLRQIFISRVWDQRLKAIIARTLQRGREELNGAPISVVLLSGGSANIGWLRELLRRDFADELAYAEILQLPDFQEGWPRGWRLSALGEFIVKTEIFLRLPIIVFA